VPQQEISSEKLQEVYLQVLQSVRSYLREMNVSEQLADAMFRTEPEKIRFLTEKAAESYNLTAWDPVYKELKDVEEAKSLGLGRQEFMYRRSLALKDCAWLASSIYEPIDDWLNCYNGVMTKTRPPPLRPPPPPGTPDLSQFGTPADPIDWSRQPLR
jgi:hypothetical protein